MNDSKTVGAFISEKNMNVLILRGSITVQGMRLRENIKQIRRRRQEATECRMYTLSLDLFYGR